MADRNLIAEQYADAFYELVREDSYLHLEAELVMAKDVITDNKELWRFLTSPMIKTSDKRKVFEKVLKTMALADKVADFLSYLVMKERMSLLNQVVERFQAHVRQLQNKEKCLITSAFALTSVQLSQLKLKLDAYAKKDLIVETHVDPQLIGGIEVLIGETKLDFNYFNRLDNVKKALQAV